MDSPSQFPRNVDRTQIDRQGARAHHGQWWFDGAPIDVEILYRVQHHEDAAAPSLVCLDVLGPEECPDEWVAGELHEIARRMNATITVEKIAARAGGAMDTIIGALERAANATEDPELADLLARSADQGRDVAGSFRATEQMGAACKRIVEAVDRAEADLIEAEGDATDALWKVLVGVRDEARAAMQIGGR